jgi:hypothetical protein
MPKKMTNRLVAGAGISITRADPDDWEATIEATGSGNPVAIDDDGAEVVADVARINFGDNLAVTDDGGGTVTIDGAAGGAGSYAETVGDGAEDTFTITHSLDTADVSWWRGRCPPGNSWRSRSRCWGSTRCGWCSRTRLTRMMRGWWCWPAADREAGVEAMGVA